MRWLLERISGPDSEPITLSEMKVHLREYSSVTTRDDEITELIQAAREWIEEYTGRILFDQTWRLSIDQTGDMWLDPTVTSTTLTGVETVTSPGFYLRRSPILEVVSVVMVDADGSPEAEDTVDASEYELRGADSKFPFLVPTGGAWRDANLRITFRAGFADRTSSPVEDSSVVPARFKQAMKLWAKGHYDGDEASLNIAMKLAKDLKAQVGFA